LREASDIFLLQNVKTGSGAYSFLFRKCRVSLQQVKQTGPKFIHSYMTVVEVKDEYSYTATSQYIPSWRVKGQRPIYIFNPSFRTRIRKSSHRTRTFPSHNRSAKSSTPK